MQFNYFRVCYNFPELLEFASYHVLLFQESSAGHYTATAAENHVKLSKYAQIKKEINKEFCWPKKMKDRTALDDDDSDDSQSYFLWYFANLRHSVAFCSIQHIQRIFLSLEILCSQQKSQEKNPEITSIQALSHKIFN